MGFRRVTLWAAAAMLAAAGAAQAQWTWTPETGRFVNIKHMPEVSPELQLEHARKLLEEAKYGDAIRATNRFNKYYDDSDLADQNQFLRGEIRLAQGKHLRAAREFQQVVANYPDTSLFEQVIAKQYEIGDYFFELGEKRMDKAFCLFRKVPFKRAIRVYTMVIDNQPFTDEAAEAQYKVGLCEHKREQYVSAAYEYRRVIEDYAGSDWVDDASYGLALCYYNGSHKALYDQAPSLLAIEAIDEFLRRFPNDERGEELAGLRAEMRERVATQRLNTAKFYEKRREYFSARLYYQVVVEEFEETQAAGEARQWLASDPSAATALPPLRDAS